MLNFQTRPLVAEVVTESGKIVFEYLNSTEISSDWKMDENIFALIKTAKSVQTALDEKFAGRGLENPWIAKTKS